MVSDGIVVIFEPSNGHVIETEIPEEKESGHNLKDPEVKLTIFVTFHASFTIVPVVFGQMENKKRPQGAFFVSGDARE